MKLTRKVILSALLLTFTSFTFAQQQTVKKNNETKKETQEEETSVEDEYLNDVDGEIITTLADSAIKCFKIAVCCLVKSGKPSI